MKAPSPAPRVETFEDFASKDGSHELFDKIDRLDVFMRETYPGYLSGLGLEMLGAVRNQVGIREKDGTAHDVIMMGSNSYLSLNTHPRVVAASEAALHEYGYGMGSVSLLAGTSALHRELERRIAAFYGTEDAILFPCGYSGNVGIVAALCGPGDVVINDAANHASIFDGCKLSGADVKVFVHKNLKHLEKILRALPEAQRGRLLITDGVFSMDGDVAPLDALHELAQRYGTRLMIDEAHALGVIGPTGRGTAEHFGLQGKIDVIYGTLSKAPAAVGGYCAGSANLVQYLRYYARSYVFSSSLPAPVVAGLIEVFGLMSEDAAGRTALWKNIHYLVPRLQALGFNTGATHSAIIPLIIGDEPTLSEIHRELRGEGVFTSVVTYPAVRRKECRLRLSLMSTHTPEQLDRVLEVLERLGRKYGLIP